MGAGKVCHMDIVANASAVRGWIISAKHLQRGVARSGTQGQRDKMGFRIVMFAQHTRRRRAFQQPDHATKVVVIVMPRVAHAFANIGRGGEMDDPTGVMRPQARSNRRSVAHVALHHWPKPNCARVAS